MDFKRVWPIGLFLVTVCLAIAASVVTTKYEASVKQTQVSADKLAQLKQTYDTTLSTLPGPAVEAAPKVTIPTPTFRERCSSPLGVRVCAPEATTFAQAIVRPGSSADAAVRSKLDSVLSDMKKASSDAGASVKDTSTLSPTYDAVHTIMQPLVSLVVLAATLYIVISKKYGAEQEKWAFGSIGTLIGFWLK